MKNLTVQNNLKKFLYILSMSFLILSCQSRPQFLNKHDFFEFIENEDNGLKKNHEFESNSFTMYYVPKEVLNEDKSVSNDNTKSTFKMIIKSNKNKDVLKENVKEQGYFYYRLEYLNHNITKDLFLIDGDDTLNCLLSQFEYFEGLSPNVTLNIAFQKFKSDKITIVFNDKLWNNGIMNFTFNKEDLINLPKIKN